MAMGDKLSELRKAESDAERDVIAAYRETEAVRPPHPAYNKWAKAYVKARKAKQARAAMEREEADNGKA